MNQDHKFMSGVVPPSRKSEPSWWFGFQGDKLLVHLEADRVRVPSLIDFAELGLPAASQHYLGRLDNRHCYAVELAEGDPPPVGMAFKGLRQVYDLLDEDLFWVAGRAVQIVDWNRTHQFCGRCGIKTKTHPTERAKECPQCGLLHFPRLSPAIIVLAEHGHEMLLARARRFPTPMYSTLAGFVEPGETLEEAVLREVKEETGIVVKDVRYFGSQPWPFPHSLMIGFTASYESGEITLQDEENIDARWFSADDLPPLPGKISIARKLIDWFLEKQRQLPVV
jgi:NAD+ diphosphatase